MAESLFELIKIKYIISAIIYSGLGIFLLAISFYILDKLTPGKLWNEIVEKRNIGLAIITAAMTLAIGQIIAAAIHG